MSVAQMPTECRYIDHPRGNFSAVSEYDPTSWEPIEVKSGHPFAKQFVELRHLARRDDMFYTTEHCEKCGWITAIRISAGV